MSRRILPALALALAFTLGGTLSAAAAPNPEGVAFFEKKIRPLLAEHCYKCHAATADKLKGGLLLDSQEGWMQGGDSGEAIIPGQPDASRLIQAVRYQDPDFQMPPKYRLSDAEIAALEQWVALGAPDPRSDTSAQPLRAAIDIQEGKQFWAFQPPHASQAPAVRDSAWAKDDLDRYILARLEADGLEPNPDADRRTLIRRVTFDLTGLPPSPEEIQSFVADPAGDDAALAALVDRLLASPRFGERWGRHWLDTVRYAESMGRTRNWPFPYAWRYRDYVIDAFNADKPYDRFLTEQIAGDLLPHGSAEERDEHLIATGFLALGAQDLNERNAEQYTMDLVDEQIDVVGRAFMALTTGCARCHDHKFDPIPTADYYALAGIFRSTQVRSGYSNRMGNNNKYFQPDLLIALEGADPEAAGPPPAPAKPNPANTRRRQALEKRITALNEEIQALIDAARAPRKRAANSNQDAYDSGASTNASLTPAEAKQKVRELRRQVAVLQNQLDNDTPVAAPPNMAMGVVDGKPVDCRVNIKGEPRNLGEKIPRGFLQVLCGGPPPELPDDRSGRLELARWMTDRQHPLTARVMVNRVWQHLFGSGLVATVDNFGATGDRPTHPQLLDHLALRFMDQDWSVKRLIRELVLSRTYRLSSAHHEARHARNPDNSLLWRMNVRRLEVEALRDGILAASGRLELEPPEGSPVSGLRLAELGRAGYSAAWEDSGHRSVYLPVLRNSLPPMFEVFDFAEPSSVMGRRDVTTVATQALYMMNSRFVIDQARHMADLLLLAHPSLPDERLQLAYTLALGRAPSEAERRRALDFVQETAGALSVRQRDEERDAWAGLCQALFAGAEFRYVQ